MQTSSVHRVAARVRVLTLSVWTDRVQPWLHYVPVKTDLSDLHHIMAFFLGDADGRGGHDDIGRQIGEDGRRWAADHWRVEDMQAYMYRVRGRSPPAAR